MAAASPRKNNVSAAAVVVLLVIAAAEMVPVALSEDGCSCRHLSSDYYGVCLNSNGCDQTCKNESGGGSKNYRGSCDDFPPRCYCYSQCALP
ncbi:unnamed protein product [Urochloa decumbens]|uniref:Knottins-like domain-containing protein n=1 Tax=Urochloa decumbens TaxID=240449 RepID=A0ABC9AZC7_9POAL